MSKRRDSDATIVATSFVTNHTIRSTCAGIQERPPTSAPFVHRGEYLRRGKMSNVLRFFPGAEDAVGYEVIAVNIAVNVSMAYFKALKRLITF